MEFEKGAIMTEKKCESCRFYKDGECYVLLWANGEKEKIGSVPGNGKCDLWEPKNE